MALTATYRYSPGESRNGIFFEGDYMIKELHEEAEKNRAFIENIKANKQDFIDPCFLLEFKSAVDIYGKCSLEDDIENTVKAGKTKFSKSFF